MMSHPGTDTRTLNTRTNGHIHSSTDANSSKSYDEPSAFPANTSSQVGYPQDLKNTNKFIETDTETQKQTKKILEEFLKRSLEKKANGIQSESKINRVPPRQHSKGSRVQIDGRTKPSPLHMKREADQRKLEDLMTGRYQSPSHQLSNASIGSTDSTDSGRFQRSGSFAIAQRNSVVTELESQVNNNESLRRRNSERIRAQSSHHEDTVTETGSSAKHLSSPIAHSRASSDTVTVKCATTKRRDTPKKEAKEKKSWLPKFHFKKKREGHKLRSSKDSVTPVEADVCGPPGHKIPKTPSDSRRKTSTPPASPKRTPKLLRRFASIIRKESPSASQSNTPRRHQSFEKVETASESTTTVSKSNSLPSKVGLSTQPQHSSEPRHRVVLDGSQRQRKNKGNVQRPNTLDLRKKKSSKFSRTFKKIFFDPPPSSSSSSSSSSLASSASAPDLIPTGFHSGTITDGRSLDIPDGEPGPNKSAKDSKPSVTNVRGQYHHSQSKSMSDMDSQEKSLSVIAAKLKSIADALHQTQYAGPAGRTQTPDSYQHDLRAKGDQRSSSVNRSKSTSATKVTSMSLKAYHNIEQAKTRQGDLGLRDHSQRITRDAVYGQHRQMTKNWSDRVESEKRNASYTWLNHEKHQGQAVNSDHRSSTSARQESAGRTRQFIPESHSPERGASRSPMPPLMKSTSPKLRSSRQARVTTDSGASKRQISRRYSKHSDTTVITSSPTGSTMQLSEDVDFYQLVQSDVVPFPGQSDEGDVDGELGLAAGFVDGYESEERETTVTIRREGIEYPSTEPVRRSYDELDNVDSEEEKGAVGGEDLHQDGDDDKLVDEIVRVLFKQVNEYKHMDSFERFLINCTKERFNMLVQRAISKVYNNVSSCRHPEVVQLAVIFEMFSAVWRLSTQPAVSGYLSSLINNIVSNFGGWRSLENSIDETSEEMRINEDGTKSPHRDEDKTGKDDSDEVD